MTRFLTLIAALTLPAAMHAAEGPGDGFVPIFDGTLKDWDGDPVYWRVENCTLIGEVRPDTLLQRNTFIIWRGGEVVDFELKLEYRVSAEGNSGINYRSSEVEGVKWAMRGYQADIDGRDQWSGQNYEERGRTFLAYRGQSVVMKTRGDVTGREVLREPAGLKLALGDDVTRLLSQRTTGPNSRMGVVALLRQVLDEARSYHAAGAPRRNWMCPRVSRSSACSTIAAGRASSISRLATASPNSSRAASNCPVSLSSAASSR